MKNEPPLFMLSTANTEGCSPPVEKAVFVSRSWDSFRDSQYFSFLLRSKNATRGTNGQCEEVLFIDQRSFSFALHSLGQAIGRHPMHRGRTVRSCLRFAPLQSEHQETIAVLLRMVDQYLDEQITSLADSFFLGPLLSE